MQRDAAGQNCVPHRSRPPRKRKREDDTEGDGRTKRRQADEDETGRPRRPQQRREAEVDDNKTEAGDEQDCP